MTTAQAAAGGGRAPAGKTTWLAWWLCAVSLTLMALSVALIVLGRTAVFPASPTEWTAASWAEQIAGIVGALGAPILGALIASHRPRNLYGWLWCALGLASAINSAAAYAVYALLVAPGRLPGGFAALRHRLYDIDRLLNRTVVYGLLTAILVLGYVASVLVLGQLFGQGRSSLAVAGATLAMAAVFQPLRHRLQDAVDRRFNRRRYDAARTMEAFTARLRAQIDLDTLSEELLAVVDQTITRPWSQPRRRCGCDHQRNTNFRPRHADPGGHEFPAICQREIPFTICAGCLNAGGDQGRLRP
jgi:hypothetical protein